jgi:hypothetical protein
VYVCVDVSVASGSCAASVGRGWRWCELPRDLALRVVVEAPRSRGGGGGGFAAAVRRGKGRLLGGPLPHVRAVWWVNGGG